MLRYTVQYVGAVEDAKSGSLRVYYRLPRCCRPAAQTAARLLRGSLGGDNSIEGSGILRAADSGDLAVLTLHDAA